MGEGQMREIVDLLTKFSIDKLSSEWIRSVIDADFTEVDDLPSEFEDFHCSTNFHGLFDAVVGSCRHWIDSLPVVNDDIEKRLSISSSHSSPQVSRTRIPSLPDTSQANDRDIHTTFWMTLAENVSVKGLKALLFYYIHRGQRYDARELEREYGIKSASIYFLLLCVPGSNAFRVFHPVLYMKTIEILRLTLKLRVGSSSPVKKGRNRGSGRKSHDEQSNHGDDDDDDEAEMAMLTPVEANKLIRSLNILLNDFLRLTHRFSFKHSSECLDETINILIDVSRAETRDAQGIFLGRHGPSTVTALAYNAYVALQSICNPIHGKINRIVILIMKHIMYNILMISRGCSDLSPRSLGVIRDHSQIFVKYLLTQVKEDAYEGVYILIQHICIRVPDKAEYRQKTAQSVVEILRYLPIQLYTRLVKWFFKFSHNEKAGHRLFMLEVIAKMLDEKERVGEDEEMRSSQSPTARESRPTSRVSSMSSCDDNDNDAGSDSDYDVRESGENSFLKVNVDHPVEVPPDRNILSHKFLLGIIFSRCRDSGATVRAKALALLAECTYSKNPTIVMAMKQIFFRNRPLACNPPHIPNNNVNAESPLEVEGEEDLDLPNASMVVSMLHRRALDDKVIVRKSALQVLENLMKLDNEMLNDKNLEVLMEHCRDPALLIRKQMIISLSGLLESYSESESITTFWIKGVFPLILDPEIKVQEKVIDYIDLLLFRRLVPYNHPQRGTPEHRLPWLIVSRVTKLSFHKFFNKALMMWSKSEYNRPQVVKVVRSYVGTEYNEEMWTLLAALSNYIVVTDAAFVVDYFEEKCQSRSMVGSYTLQQVLKVLSNSIKHIPGHRGEALHERLLHPVVSFSVGSQLISAMMDTLTLLTYSMHGDEEKGLKALEKWVGPILKACDDYLKSVLFEKSIPADAEGEEKLFRHIFTLGEAAMLCPCKVNRRMFLMVQSIIFHQSRRERLRTVRIPSSQTQSSQPTAISFKPTTRVRAVAVVTLGKMCLQNEEQAKRIIPALGKMLDTQICSALKINIVFTLSDMCVRYATLVDPLMPQVTACLRDPDLEVRRTTLTLLINLLQEDYLKLKGSFFYRILQCLADEHEDVRSTVLFYITERLLKRFPKILCQHFIECIFHYNCYEEHESYNRFLQSSVEKELFSLAGKEHAQDRMMIYKFMLDHMPDDQRFTTTQRLCQDVLGGVVDGRVKLSATSLPMLEDTLSVLRCDEIKLASLKSRPEDVDQPTDQAEQAAMAGMVIKKTIISQVVKRHVIENIVPILIAVKHKLEEHKSPLMKHLLLYLKEIMKDYKNEIKEILAGDKQLAQEIEFDLRRFDQEQKEKEEELERRKTEDNSAEELRKEGKDIPEENTNAEEQECLVTSPKKNDPGSVTSPKISPAAQNDVHKQAVMNSKEVLGRRKSCIAPVPYKQDDSGQDNVKDSVPSSKEVAEAPSSKPEVTGRGTRKTKMSARSSDSGKEGSNRDNPAREKDREINEKDDISADNPSSGSSSPLRNNVKTPTKKMSKKTKEELIRAISTPQQKSGVINNITFMEEQNISAITLDSTISTDSSRSHEQKSKRVMHQEGNTKESESSRTRRSSRKSETKSRSAQSASKGLDAGSERCRPQSVSTTDVDRDTSAPAKEKPSPHRSKTRGATEAASKGKRTRDMTSLSPDPKDDGDPEKPKNPRKRVSQRRKR
ncbi:condensin-2 complex subunit D3-L-like [Palaemon carinicauda]|uniref:condensin-2 complex subunit D3-L-like n=1 Tax=Palaemon carinicauda TaxID=392227 RepID=UPI0035B5E7FC